MKHWRVEWKERTPVWGEVLAESKDEAIEKAKRNEFLPDSIDSDPGPRIPNSYSADEIGSGSNTRSTE